MDQTEKKSTSSRMRLRLVGVELAGVEALTRSFDSHMECARRCVADERLDPSVLPRPLPAGVPVFADASGRRFTLMSGAIGPVAVGHDTGGAMDLDARGLPGGYLDADQIQTRKQRASDNGRSADPVTALNVMAVQALARDQAGDDAPSGTSGRDGAAARSSKGLLDGLPAQLAKGLAQQLVNMGAQAYGSAGSIGAMCSQLGGLQLSDLATQVGLGAVQQLAGMATQMLFSELWSVDDESSAGEHVAHHFAQQAVGQVQQELLDRALASLGLGDQPDSVAERIRKFLCQASADSKYALRVTDVDPGKNAVLTGSPDVNIEGQLAAREGDNVDAAGVAIEFGATLVNINGKLAARIVDSKSQVGPFAMGAVRTIIGGPTNAPPPELSTELPGASATQFGENTNFGSSNPKAKIREAIDQIKKSKFGQTPEGKAIVQKLEQLNQAGKIGYADLKDGTFGQFDGNQILIDDSVSNHTEYTAIVLAHEGTHATSSPNMCPSISEEVHARENQLDLYEELKHGDFKGDGMHDSMRRDRQNGTLDDRVRNSDRYGHVNEHDQPKPCPTPKPKPKDNGFETF